MRVALISLESWDGVWRRNQYLTAELVRQGLVEQVLFVEPPARGGAQSSRPVEPGVQTLRPRRMLPNRLGGLSEAAAWVRRRTRDVDVLWVNDPALGVRVARGRQAVVYDVTDDWRTFAFPRRIIRRITRAEGELARRASTVVCSEVLRERWQQRYGVTAAIVNNGIDAESWADVVPRALEGRAPHVAYIGTLHQERLDLDVLLSLARSEHVGTLHLIGPDALSSDARRTIADEPKIHVHGPVDAGEVPAWSTSMDVLVCPHRITDFTMSLDAIKAREYLASGRPVVATPTSGFQLMAADVTLASAADFVSAVERILTRGGAIGRRPDVRPEWTWASRAREFHQCLQRAARTESVHSRFEEN